MSANGRHTVILPAVLDQALAAVEARRRRLALGRGLALAAVAFVTGVVAVAAIDALLLPPIAARRWLSWGLYLVVGLIAFWVGLRPSLRRPDRVAAARLIEAAGVARDEQLSAAVQLATAAPVGVSRWMVDRTVALAANVAAGIDPRRVIDGRAARRWGLAAGLLGLLLVISLVEPGARTLVLRAVLPGVDLVRPSNTALIVRPGGAIRLARGSDLRIVAQVDPAPEQVRLSIAWDDGLQETLPMVPEGGGRYVRTLRGLSQACRFRVQAGDAESAATRVDLDEPPRLESLQVRVQPPDYTGQGERSIPGGDAEAPLGSQIALEAEIRGAAVRDAVVVEADGTERTMRIDGGVARCAWRIDATTTYGLRLVSSDGLVVEPAQRWRIEVHADAEPTVQLRRDGGTSVGADESVLLALDAADDLGLRSVRITWRGPDGSTGSQPVAGDALTDVRLERLVPFDLGRFGLRVGDRIVLHAEARDRGGQVARSEELALQVTAEEVAAGAALSDELRACLAEVDALRKRWETWGSGWTALRLAYRGEDHALHRGTVMVHRSALQRIAGRSLALATRLEALDGTELVAEHAHRIALGLRAWDEDRLAALARRVDALDAERPPPGAERGVAAAERIAGLAGDQLDRLADWLRLLAAAHDASVLHGRSDAAFARLERSLAVLRARRAWLDPRVEPGLRRALFRGDKPAGKPAHRDVAPPTIDEDASLPEVGREQFAVRWVGEIRIPTGGPWDFVGMVDDGLRVRIGGEDVLAKGAWAEQPPTEHRGPIALEPGWHPIEIEYYQGKGGKFLRCWLEREGERRALGPGMLRHRVEADLVAAMLQISPGQVERATLAAGEDLAQLVAAPSRADQLALEGGANRVHGQVRELREDLSAVEDLRRTDLAAHGTIELDALVGGVRPVVDLTARAAAELRRLLEDRSKDWTPEEASLARLADRAGRLQRELERLHRERDALQDAIGFEQRADDLRAEAEVLGAQLRHALRQAHAGARSAEAGIAERLSQVELEVGLGELVHRELPRLEDALGQLATEADAAQRGAQAAGGLERGLERLAGAEEALARARGAREAAQALAADDRVRAAAAEGRRDEAALAGDERARHLAALEEDLRAQGDAALARRLAAGRASPSEAPLERAPRRALTELAQADREALAAADTGFDQELAALAAAWEQGPDRADRLALAALPLRVDAGAQRLRSEGADEQARALEGLAAGLRDLGADPDAVQAQDLRALSQADAAALAVTEAATTTAEAEAMQALAAGLQAEDAATRDLARSELARLAAADTASRLERAEAALTLADRLDAARAALERAEQEEREAVMAFAEREAALAERMRELRPPLDAVADADLRTALEAAGGALPEHAERAEELAQAARRAVADEAPSLASAEAPAGPEPAAAPAAEAEAVAADPATAAAEALARAEQVVARAAEAVSEGDPRGLAAGLQRAANQALAEARSAAAEAEELAATAAGDERPAAAAAAAEDLGAARARSRQQAEAAESLARNAESLARGGLPRSSTDPQVADSLSREAQREADRLTEAARVQGSGTPAAQQAAAALRRALDAHRALADQVGRAPPGERGPLRAGLQQRLSAAAAAAAALDRGAAGMDEEIAALRSAAAAAGDGARAGSDGARERLASEALEAAGAIERELARPVAAAQDRALSAGRVEEAAAAFGQELAGLAAEQRAAATRLSRAMAHRDALRQELAAGLAQAEALRAGSTPVAAAPQGAAQAAAEARQQAATEAWGQAAAGGEAATAAAAAQHAATAAQAEALGRDPGMLPAVQRRRAVDNLAGALGAMRTLPDAAATAATADAAAATRSELARAAGGQGAAAASAAQDLRAQADDLVSAGSGDASPALTAAARSALEVMAAADERVDGSAAAASLATAAAGQRLAATASGQAIAAPALAAGAPQAGRQPGQGQQPGEGEQPGQGQQPGRAEGGTDGLGSVSGSDPGSLAGLDAAVAGLDQADWARLPERVRQAVRRGDWERFGEEYQAAIRAYFTALSEED